MKVAAFLSCLLLLSFSAVACLNESRATLSGAYIDLDEEVLADMRVLVPVGRDFIAERAANSKRLEKLDSLYHARYLIKDYSDYGVVLVYLGRFEEARKVFENIEAQKPGLYDTAANLGTVYELLGQNNKALYWIQQAVLINPRSHQGSEWIHVNILKAKVQGSNAVNSRFLLGTDFGTAAIPVSTNSLVAQKQLRNALYYQLSERLSFVKTPDRIVGQLLFDLGNLYALTSNIESALDVYDKAKQYEFDGKVLNKRYAYFTWLKHKDDLLGLLILTGLFGLITLGIIKMVKRVGSRMLRVRTL